MKHKKKVINIVIHKATGARVPVVVRKVDANNIITDYAEYTDKRKGFSLIMLTNRWDKCVEDVIELLQKYQVPGYLRHADVQFMQPHEAPASKAVFFEEYIYGIERKTKMPHSKLKAKLLQNFTEH